MQLDLIVITYGFGERRVEIEMRPAIPSAYVGNVDELARWAQMLSFGFGQDVKHTERWGCSICGVYSKHRRESDHPILTRSKENPPERPYSASHLGFILLSRNLTNMSTICVKQVVAHATGESRLKPR